ncbi:PBSX family phage terminase large subunit [Solibacillus silvestris]
MATIDLEYAAHFENFLFDWEHKIYLAIGSYGSGKSHSTVLKILLKLLKEKRRCAVIREVYETHLESTYQLLQEVAEVLDPDGKLIKFKKSPLSVEFYNGSKIIFKGLDKVEKMKGLQGVSVVWLEESSEVKYNGYKELLLRLRTRSQSLHILLSTNPVSKDNWVYTHFFKNEETGETFIEESDFYQHRTIKMDDMFIHHSTVDDNPFVPETYVKELDNMKTRDPDLWRVARLGHFGILGERVFHNVHKAPHEEVMAALNRIRPIYKNGLDFGFVTSYNAFIQCAIDHNEKILYIYNEHYKRGESDKELADALMPYRKSLITADNAEPKTIAYLQQLKFRILGAKKGPGSVLGGMKKLKRFNKIIISDNCPNAQRDFSTLTFKKDKNDKIIEDEFNIDPHAVDAVRYAIEDYEVATVKGANAKRY